MNRIAKIISSAARLVAVALLTFAAPVLAAGPDASGISRANALANLPLCFEAAQSEAGEPIQFLSRGPATRLVIAPTEARLTLTKVSSASAASQPSRAAAPQQASVTARTVRLEFTGGNRDARVAGEVQMPGRINYFIGNDPSQWRRGVPTFERVRVREVYPGIEVVYYGNQQRLEYDFVVAPEADPSAISIRVEGADRIVLDGHGELILKLGEDEIRQPKPEIYQMVHGERKTIAGGYALNGARGVRFQIGDYDHALPLVIDPVLNCSTYFGGGSSDVAWDVAVDHTATNSVVYVAGETLSLQLATPGAYQTNIAGISGVWGDAFVAKLGNNCSNLIYLTYLGGLTADAALAMSVDAAGNAFLTGYTDSTNFPCVLAISNSIAGGFQAATTTHFRDAFVSVLDPSGSNLLFSTYLGGNVTDYGIGIAVDTSANVYVSGYTESTNFPVTGSLWTNYNGRGDGFVTKIDLSGVTVSYTNIAYSMFLGGTNQDVANDVIADGAGAAFVTGYTSSTNFPVTQSVTNFNHGQTNSTFADAFLTRLNANGTTNGSYSVFLGGIGNDYGFRLTLDGSGNAFVTGSTLSADFPKTATNLPSNLAKGGFLEDVFVTKFDSTGTNVYSVVFGGNGSDEGWDVNVDAAGHAHVVGLTGSTDFPTSNTNSVLRGVNSFGFDAFVTELSADGTNLVLSAYLGGAGADKAYAIDLDAAGNSYIVGETSSGNFPTVAARQTTLSGAKDGFLAKISQDPALSISTSNNNLLVSWHAVLVPDPNLLLQSKTNLRTFAGWTTFAATNVLTSGQHVVTFAPTNSTRFFRLRQ